MHTLCTCHVFNIVPSIEMYEEHDLKRLRQNHRRMQTRLAIIAPTIKILQYFSRIMHMSDDFEGDYNRTQQYE
jgi:hypothetical protein